MSRLAYDTETNGLLPELSVIHCLVLEDLDTGQVWRCHDSQDPTISRPDLSLEDGYAKLEAAGMTVGFNSIKFDEQAILKVRGKLSLHGVCRDAIVATRLIWPDLKQSDIKKQKQGKFPGNLINRHSLEAWGKRMGNYKGDFDGPWDTFTQEMLDYCVQDVSVLVTLWKMIEKQNYSEEAIQLEHDVQDILARQERYGFAFDTAAAGRLYASLVSKREAIEGKLKGSFDPWWYGSKVVTPPKTLNYKEATRPSLVAGAAFTRVELREFNPASRDDIANRLIKVFGWEPTEFTPEGKPKVDETTMADLPYPPVPLIMEYLLIEKRIGQLAEGKQALLRCEKNGRIHGTVTGNGAVTQRMSHSHPNVSATPKVGSFYGTEFRSLYIATPGKVLVGADASGIQLRVLAHLMAKWDEGAYVKTVCEGKEEDGTDVHSVNAVAIGLDPKALYVVKGKQQKGRNCSKTFIYAWLLGAGDEKVGNITGKGAAEGKLIKKRFLTTLPALKKLKDMVAKVCKDRGYFVGLDGRKIKIRSAYMALATILQAWEAVIMKKALVLCDKALQAKGLIPGKDYEFVANIHDEWQIETTQELADDVGNQAKEAITQAGIHFKFRCPLDGSFKVGRTWAETH